MFRRYLIGLLSISIEQLTFLHLFKTDHIVKYFQGIFERFDPGKEGAGY